MVIAPLDFEKFPPLYNPLAVPSVAASNSMPAERIVSALDAANPNSLKSELDRSPSRFNSGKLAQAARPLQAAAPLTVQNLLIDTSSSSQSAELLADQADRNISIKLAVAAYENADQKKPEAGLIIIA